jgi:CheY-like chemotaxis protein
MARRRLLVDGWRGLIAAAWRFGTMSVDLVSLRVLAVFKSAQDYELVRQGAGMVAVPVDVVEAESHAVALAEVRSNEVDVILLDSAVSVAERIGFIAAARTARPSAFIIQVTGPDSSAQRLPVEAPAVDGAVTKPTTVAGAKLLIERCIRIKIPSRVLVVDDSATMRSIVRKILAASRFPLEIAEAEEGIAALKQIGTGKFDMVFLDYNMPGLNGVETLAEIKRQFPRLQVVMITSTQDDAVAERARAAGAAAFLKKPFFPADIDTVLHSVYGLRQAPSAA